MIFARMINLIGILLLLALAFSTSEVSGKLCNRVPAENAIAQFDYAPGYPGKGEHLTVNLAHSNIQLGLILYYEVYGYWPASWRAVKESGIFQAPLIGFDGSEIDPDDGRLDFVSDIYYDPEPTDQGEAVIVMQRYLDGMITDRMLVEIPVTFDDYFETYSEAFPQSGVDEYIGNTDRLRQFAVISLCVRRAELFNKLHGRSPYSLDELMQSGLGPIDENSINHLTGQRYYGDGRANDIFYEYQSDGEIRVRPVGDNGKILNIVLY